MKTGVMILFACMYCAALAAEPNDAVRQAAAGVKQIVGHRGACAVAPEKLNLNRAFFIVRQHATNVPCEPTGRRRRVGRTDGGTVYEQTVRTADDCGNWLELRRISIELDEPRPMATRRSTC